MESAEVRYLVTLVSGWAKSEAAVPRPGEDVDAQRFLDLVQRNRLEGITHTQLPGLEGRGWEQVHAACEEAYRRNLVHGLRQLRAGTDLAARLEEAGVPCIALRGPFSGADLYGDVGLRGFTDIDLYVPAGKRREAWTTARAAGYRMARDGLPRGFFERHHLHWPLVKRDGSTSCDLHWALDHPYKLQRVDYDDLFATAETCEVEGFTWRQPEPGHLLLAAVMHLGKHCREGQGLADAPEGAAGVAARGLLRYWIEVAVIVCRYGRDLDWEPLERTAKRWRVDDAYTAALRGVSAWFGVPVPEVSPVGAGSRQPGARRSSAFAREVAKLGAFQEDRVADARAYLFPPADYFRDKSPAARTLRRVAHTAQAAPRLLLATGEALVWPAWARLTRRGRKAADAHQDADAAMTEGEPK